MATDRPATEDYFGPMRFDPETGGIERDEKDEPIRITLQVMPDGQAVIRADKGADVTVVPLRDLLDEAKTQLEWAVQRAVK